MTDHDDFDLQADVLDRIADKLQRKASQRTPHFDCRYEQYDRQDLLEIMPDHIPAPMNHRPRLESYIKTNRNGEQVMRLSEAQGDPQAWIISHSPVEVQQ